MNNLQPTYDEIHQACKEFTWWAAQNNKKYSLVAGIQRGGLLPALILSHTLEIPMLTIDYSSKSGKGDDKDHSNHLPALNYVQGPILLVDDISDSGRTLSEIYNHYLQRGVGHVDTFVLYYKRREPLVFNPTHFWRSIPEDSGWVIFPFEQ